MFSDLASTLEGLEDQRTDLELRIADLARQRAIIVCLIAIERQPDLISRLKQKDPLALSQVFAEARTFARGISDFSERITAMLDGPGPVHVAQLILEFCRVKSQAIQAIETLCPLFFEPLPEQFAQSEVISGRSECPPQI